MKHIVLILAYVCAIVLTPGTAMAQQRQAQASACYNVADADARTMCLARVHRDAGYCYSIQRDDMRAMCLAEVRQ